MVDGVADSPDTVDEPVEGLSANERVYRLVSRELGEEMAEGFASSRRAQERWVRTRFPDEGLRERKKRLTRQQISDVATTLFVVRGFENVRVSEVAETVGVSEKTVFNYFPTKESLVFDRADEGIERMAKALRERDPAESPAKAILRALREDAEEIEHLGDEISMFLPLFSEMIATTPALRAAWFDLQGRLVAVATEELAARADVDPHDPEPMIVARAIVGLHEVSYQSRTRHIEAGLRGAQLRDAVLEDIERAARLLDTGLWSFNLLAQGERTRAQLREAAKAAEEARAQVIEALKQARVAWKDLRKQEHADFKSTVKDMSSPDKRALKRSASRAGEAAWRSARKAQQSLRDARVTSEQVAYEAFHEALRERHEAIRRRQGQDDDRPG